MAKLLRLEDYRRKNAFVSFRKEELQQLLNLYSRRVAMGEWRDYAIDNGPGMAVFTVYRSAQDRQLFQVVKFAKGSYGQGDETEDTLQRFF